MHQYHTFVWITSVLLFSYMILCDVFGNVFTEGALHGWGTLFDSWHATSHICSCFPWRMNYPTFCWRRSPLWRKGNQNIKLDLRKFMEVVSLIDRRSRVLTSSEVLNSNRSTKVGCYERSRFFLVSHILDQECALEQNVVSLFTSSAWMLRIEYSLKERHEIIEE
jgi:hypothetical protein